MIGLKKEGVLANLYLMKIYFFIVRRFIIKKFLSWVTKILH
jgi:hypothetical protein